VGERPSLFENMTEKQAVNSSNGRVLSVVNLGHCITLRNQTVSRYKEKFMTKSHDLAQLGQSVWYDNIRRAIIDSGELQQLLDDGVLGITSNPSIFEKAIAGSADYDEAIQELVAQGKSTEVIYETLALEDIGRAADMLRSVYDATDGVDGYVSLEVSPTLAHDTAGTIADARRFFAALNRPNIMIKVPATPAGMPAIRQLISEGINVNVTLIFSLESHEAVMEAYIAGLEANNGDLSRVASVASFFVSRVDAAVDKLLDEKGNTALQGKIAIANAKAAYKRFQEVFAGPRWEALAEKGARVQRPLWASTSTKNPTYPDTLYIDELVGPHTVNTVPPATLVAFNDHGTAAETLTAGVDEALAQLGQLAAVGVDLTAVTQKLQDDGVAAFAESFESLLASVAQKQKSFAV
jgi:transaldolase